MRAGIGFIALLLGIALILFLLGGRLGGDGRSYLQTVMDARKQAHTDIYSFQGQDASGTPLHQTLTLEPEPERGPMRGLIVASIDPAGIAATHFGLRTGDVITQIGPHPVGDTIVGSVEDGQMFLDEAMARGQSLTVRRDGQTLTLPRDAGVIGDGQGGLPEGLPEGLPGGLPGTGR